MYTHTLIYMNTYIHTTTVLNSSNKFYFGFWVRPKITLGSITLVMIQPTYFSTIRALAMIELNITYHYFNYTRTVAYLWQVI